MNKLIATCSMLALLAACGGMEVEAEDIELEPVENIGTSKSALTTVSLTASPSIVPAPLNGTGTTRICWRVSDYPGIPLYVRVRVDGGPGALFATETRNGRHCQDATWIVAGHRYDFRVHNLNSDTVHVYAHTQVTGVLETSNPSDPPNCNPICP